MNNSEKAFLNRLYDLKTIREQAQRLLKLARRHELTYFDLDEQQLPATAAFVIDIIQSNYPARNIPYHSRWRHFEAGGIDRIKSLDQQLQNLPPKERGKIFYELVIISVFLDAGAGKDWRYYEADSKQYFNRSEGLAIASLDLYLQGGFSADPSQPLRVDSQGLLAMDTEAFKKAFQINEKNPMEGLDGRISLLKRLSKILRDKPDYFGQDARLGNFYHYVYAQSEHQTIKASQIFQSVLSAFNDIWPKRLQYQGVNLGDVWRHPALKTEQEGSDYIPFHKLSQWLSYSLIEPLEWAGVRVCGIHELTGLPEYRNGGLFIDLGVLKVKKSELLSKPFSPDSEAIIEWRGLTVALLDELAHSIREALQLSESDLPLAKILQGGTWQAGRVIAGKYRKNASPPIEIISDGTVF